MTVFYNDAYIPLAGRCKHPFFLGKSTREMWPELWDSFHRIMVERVYNSGEAITGEDVEMFLERSGEVESAFFSFSFNPAYNEAGEIAGIFCICYESTAKVLLERRINP